MVGLGSGRKLALASPGTQIRVRVVQTRSRILTQGPRHKQTVSELWCISIYLPYLALFSYLVYFPSLHQIPLLSMLRISNASRRTTIDNQNGFSNLRKLQFQQSKKGKKTEEMSTYCV